MRIFGIRLRFTVAVALALAGYVAFLPQKIDPGRNRPAERSPTSPPATPPVPAPAQVPQQPTSPPTEVQTPPQTGSQPNAVSGHTAPPAASPEAEATGSQPANGQAATTPAPASQLPGEPSAAASAPTASPSATEPTMAPLTAAQRAAAQESPAPDSALPTIDSKGIRDGGSGGPGGMAAGASTEVRALGAGERTGQPATRAVTSPKPTLLGGPATGIPIPPKPQYNRGQYLADTALSFRGLPYKWGGTSPDTGMDCSGFIVAVLKKWHIDVPHSVIAQHQLGKPIRLAEIQPGDLMFFKNTYKPGLSHVAIYVGDNQFVDAGDEKVGVMLRELGPHGMEHWVDARRLDPSLLPPAPGEPLLAHHK